MRCATGVSAAGSASGEILQDEFLKPLGLTANAPQFCGDALDLSEFENVEVSPGEITNIQLGISQTNCR